MNEQPAVIPSPGELREDFIVVGFTKTCTRGRAMNPNTVMTGQVATRVCRRGSPATTSHHCSKRFSSPPGPHNQS